MPEALLRPEGGGRGSRGLGARGCVAACASLEASLPAASCRDSGGPQDAHTLASITSTGDDNRYTSGALSARKRNAFSSLGYRPHPASHISSFAPHRVSLTAPLTHVIHVQRRDGARSTAARGLAHATAPLPAARAHQAFRSDSALSICSQTPVVAAAVPG